MGALLEVEDVVVRFGGVTAVNRACFTADRGVITGLIGPNGAGKTTCFNVITGLQRPTKGRVRYRDRDVTGWPVHRRARQGIGRTFQRLEAFGSLTVRDNVRVAAEIHVLDFGEIIASGAPADIRADPDVQRAYLGYAEGDVGADGDTTVMEAIP